jgi:transcriptional regulator with XRE-family HTH domain
VAKDPGAVQLGARIRELREAAGLSRKALAETSGTSERAIIKWELGEREPGWFNMLALGKALNVSCETFTQPPAEREPSGPGRPPKPKDPAEAEKSKRPRGRPRKVVATVEVETAPKRPRGRPKKG